MSYTYLKLSMSLIQQAFEVFMKTKNELEFKKTLAKRRKRLAVFRGRIKFTVKHSPIKDKR